MKRAIWTFGPALFLALAMLWASALIAAAPHAVWSAVAAPLLLVLALVGTDHYLLRRRRYVVPGSKNRLWPSSSALWMAASILAASAIVASRDLDQFVGMIPIFGSGAALPLILRRDCAQGA